jgi:hypothetical protein
MVKIKIQSNLKFAQAKLKFPIHKTNNPDDMPLTSSGRLHMRVRVKVEL